eukprot:GILI01015655.1.p1 GENE.GILI01015655.1~~GILI01015655.1.p1  ORF type:complete len:220 (+),score=43.29 GILI01015655.1:40-660(+)
MSAVRYVLKYFPIPGRGAPIRAAFKANGVEFEDSIIPFPEWPATKATIPFGTIPLLEVHNGDTVTKINQSGPILRFVGRLGSAALYPIESPLECALIDQLVDGVEDAFAIFAPSFKENDADKKRAMREAGLPAFEAKISAIESFLAADSDFCVGGKLSIADLKLAFFQGLRDGNFDFVDPHLLDKYPRITRVMNATVAAFPGVFSK